MSWGPIPAASEIMCAQLGNLMCRLAGCPAALRSRRTAPSISLCVSRVSFSIRSLIHCHRWQIS